MVSYSHLLALKNTPFFVHPKQIFGPPYFVRALSYQREQQISLSRNVRIPQNGVKV